MKFYQVNQESLTEFQSLLDKSKEGFDLSQFVNSRKITTIEDGICNIHVSGMLMKNSTPIDRALGATDYDDIIKELEIAEQSAQAVIITFDSGGGNVSGCYEVAKKVETLNVPVIAYIPSMACSAAYKIASSASYIIAEYSATSGNIGTILVTTDVSKLQNNMGVETICFTNDGAELKSTGRVPLTEAQIKFLQDTVNEMGMEFINHVKDNRPNISNECFSAGWYHGNKAIQMGLIDSIGTYKDAVKAAQDIVKAFAID